MTRDPRIDPQPGDRIVKGDFMREVSCVRQGLLGGGTIVHYHTNYYKPEHEAPLSRWRGWAAKAEVLYVAAAREGQREK